ncbi:MAG: RND family transporter [Clostridiaceae bacterium]|nr:RND family transporter [Clostridiaceae bacterium]
MNRVSKFVTGKTGFVVMIFTVLAVVCTFLMLMVRINYNITDYLPRNAQSTIAISINDSEFSQSVPNARVMVNNVTLTEALEYKAKIAAIDGVYEVIWLDSVTDLKEPVEMVEKETVEEYYKDNTALFSVTILDGYEVSVTDEIYKLIGEENALSGNAVDLATSKRMLVSETLSAMAILIPVIIIVLLLSTSSWIEPVLFLITIGISVLINMGTNIFFGEISFMTQSISPILQMAVSLDYAIFLLHSYGDYKTKTDDIKEAMALAMKRAFPAIIASAATTLFGFMALLFMKFRIGADLGLNLVKGIVISFISVMVFLPALTLSFNNLINKTQHKKLLPDFKNISKIVFKIKVPVLILIAVIAVPCFLAQSRTDFLYGTGSLSPFSRSGQDQVKINDKFGNSTPVVLLVPKGEPAKEAMLSSDLEDIDHVTQVVSYTKMVGQSIPGEYLDPEITDQFYSDNYSRIIIYTDTNEEGEEAFTVVEQVQQKAKDYYGDKVYSLGQSVNLYDMKNVVSKDTRVVNLVAIVSIFLVLLFTFRSISLPVLLTLTIELAIWINLSIPYFWGNTLCYIGYLVVSTVQLGATVDYAILFTDNYMLNRKSMKKKEAIKVTLEGHFVSILTSAVILSSAGFCLGLTSSSPIVSELGILLGRGTLLSMAMVVCFLPPLLVLGDKIIEKTTLKADFFKER